MAEPAAFDASERESGWTTPPPSDFNHLPPKTSVGLVGRCFPSFPHAAIRAQRRQQQVSEE